MLKKFAAVILAASTALIPFSAAPASLFAPSSVNAAGTVNAVSIPEWVPKNFSSAIEFRNTYGTVHIDNGVICVVSQLSMDTNTEDGPKGVLQYETVSTDSSVKILWHTNYSSKDSPYYYEIAVLAPQQACDFDIAVVDVLTDEPDPDLPYGHAISRYSFSAKDDLSVTETDIYGWLPDSEKEYTEYVQKHGEVSVKDNYVVFCMESNAGSPLSWREKSENYSENFERAAFLFCSEETAEPVDGGDIYQVVAYKAVKDGCAKIEWEYAPNSTWELRTPFSEDEMKQSLTADCAVLDNAQTILLSGQIRVTLADCNTDEAIILGEGEMPSIAANISSGEASTGPVLVMETNPAIVSNDLGGHFDSGSFSFSLNSSSLPKGYSFPDGADHMGYYGGTISPEDYVTITKFDNGSANVVFKLKTAPTGDVNSDGEFNVSDIVLLQKWLLGVPDIVLADWQAADFYNDDELDVFDLILMRKALIVQSIKDYVAPDEYFEFGISFLVREDGLKLYLGPDENYESVASIPQNTRLREHGYQKNNDDWLFTEYNGQYGWIRTFSEDGRTPTIFYEEVAKKPVIYLYPEEETDVHVELELTEAELSTTYPKYDNGWNVTAYPDGSLLNKADGTHHKYLFWDAVNCRTRFGFSEGFCVAGSDTESFLREKLTYMGLTEEEMNEFIVYWLPLMEHNKYNLIAFQGDAYTDSAKLNITPEPDSLLRIFMTYVPLEDAVDIQPQQLDTFERKGFTVVEWGGSEVR